MNFGNIGVSGLLVILVVVLILFGPSKLPELGRAFGRTLREFKSGTRELMREDGDPEAASSGSAGELPAGAAAGPKKP